LGIRYFDLSCKGPGKAVGRPNFYGQNVSGFETRCLPEVSSSHTRTLFLGPNQDPL